MLRISFKHFFLVASLLYFFLPQIVIASDPPNLISPSDGSSEDKTPKLSWEFKGECITSGSCFRIEIDNNPDFTSTEKESYTNSLSYSPQGLSEGNWNWRVKAKDKSGAWSEWSKVFKFTIGTSPSGNPATPTPSSTSQSIPTPTPQKNPTNFTIKDIPSEINSNQDFEASVSLVLPNDPNQKFYLKGAFKKSDSSNYFAQTYSGSEWAKNGNSYSKQLPIETNSEGKWEGKIKVKPDVDDSGFTGTDNYIFKVGRYNDSGTGPSWSNELNIKIITVEIPEPSEEPKIPEEEEDEESSESPEIIKTPPRNYEIKIASVAGEATMSNNITLEEQTRVLEEKKINWLLIFLGIGILLGGAGFSFYKIKNAKKL